MRMRIAAGIAALVSLLDANGVRASELPHAHAELDYSAPRELSACPERESFVSAVATRLGYDPFAKDARASPTLVVRFRRENSALVAHLRLVRGDGEEDAEKSLVSESGACDELGLASAFAAAVLLDPRAMFPRPAKSAGTPAGAPSLDSRSPGTWPWYEPPPSLPPPVKTAPAKEPLRVHAGVAAVGCTGCAPSPNLGAAVFAGLSKGTLGLDLGARADLPSSMRTPSGRTVSSALAVGELFPHARLGPTRPGVLGVAGGLLGDSAGEKKVSVWTGVGPRVGFEWPLGLGVVVHAALDGLLMISRVSLRVDEREVWSTPPFVVSARLGAAMSF